MIVDRCRFATVSSAAALLKNDDERAWGGVFLVKHLLQLLSGRNVVLHGVDLFVVEQVMVDDIASVLDNMDGASPGREENIMVSRPQRPTNKDVADVVQI